MRHAETSGDVVVVDNVEAVGEQARRRWAGAGAGVGMGAELVKHVDVGADKGRLAVGLAGGREPGRVMRDGGQLVRVPREDGIGVVAGQPRIVVGEEGGDGGLAGCVDGEDRALCAERDGEKSGQLVNSLCSCVVGNNDGRFIQMDDAR